MNADKTFSDRLLSFRVPTRQFFCISAVIGVLSLETIVLGKSTAWAEASNEKQKAEEQVNFPANVDPKLIEMAYRNKRKIEEGCVRVSEKVLGRVRKKGDQTGADRPSQNDLDSFRSVAYETCIETSQQWLKILAEQERSRQAQLR